MSRTTCGTCTALLTALLLTGCTFNAPMNDSFPLTRREARTALRHMADAPVELERPVVIINGWMDPGLASMDIEPRLKRHVGDDRVISVAYFAAGSFETCRRRVIDAVERAFPDDDPTGTRPVDVVGYSMGGIVARYAAMSPARRAALLGEEVDDPRRLRIARLFTISTPHQGAQLAPWAIWDGLARRITNGSEFLAQLDAALAEADYALYPYVRLDDLIVGADNAAPTGRVAWWVPTPFLSFAHTSAHKDARILADIVARLRGDPPFTRHPATPLPGEVDEPPTSMAVEKE
ncbi:MAG: esterase/lipase family protein [Phycisphaeraceae bacterium]